MSNAIEKYLTEKNGKSDFVRDIIDQLWLMPSCENDDETLNKLSSWVYRYRHENNITEGLDFPSIDDLDEDGTK